MPRPVSLADRALGREWTPPGAARFLFRLPGMGEEPAGFRLRGLQDCRLELDLVCGDGFESDGRVDADGCLTVGLAEPRTFALLLYRQAAGTQRR